MPIFLKFRISAWLTIVAFGLFGCTSTTIIKPDKRIRSIDNAPAVKTELENRAAMKDLDEFTISLANSYTDREYRVGPDDVISVEMFRIEELSGEYTLDREGKINLPLLGRVTVVNMTLAEIEDTLQAAYEKDYLQDPQITVAMVAYQSKKVTLISEIGGSGVVSLRGSTTLMDIFAQVGAVNRLSDLESVIIFREEGESIIGYLADMEKILGGQIADPEVFANDRIVVPLDSSAVLLRSFSLGVPGFGGYTPLGAQGVRQ